MEAKKWGCGKIALSLSGESRTWRFLKSHLVGMDGSRSWRGGTRELPPEPGLQAVHGNINDGRGEKREHLAEDEAANDGDAQRWAQFGANSPARSKRQSAKKRTHGRHSNGPG